MLIVMLGVYGLAPLVEQLMLAAAVFIAVLVFVVYSSMSRL